MEAPPNISDNAFPACMLHSKNGSTTQRLRTSIEGFANRPGTDRPAFVDTWKPVMVTCLDPPKWSAGAMLSLQLVEDVFQPDKSSAIWLGQVLVEAIAQNLAGDIGACISPYVTARPTTADWLLHHHSLGVSAFYFYIPEGSFVDSAIEQYSGEANIRQLFPPLPFTSHLIWWTLFWPSSKGLYFGQALSYSECVFRNRRKHKFLLFLDLDEFLMVASNTTLPKVLNELLPATHASLVFPVSRYTVECARVGDVEAYQGLDVLADPLPDVAHFAAVNQTTWYYNAKVAVRPLAIIAQHVHQPLKMISSVEWMPLFVPPSVAALKHLRCTTAAAWAGQ